jgi:hypothetical protein
VVYVCKYCECGTDLPDDEERLLPVIRTAEVADVAVRVWRVLETAADRRRELGLAGDR